MAKLFLTSIDLNSNELQNGVIQNLASAPGTPSAGRIYYDTTLSKIGYYNGAAWIYTAISSITGIAPITASTNANGAVTVSINAATGSLPGSMSAADKTKLDASTAANTSSTIVLRDGSGSFAANLITMNQGTVSNAPTNATDIANKAYVDALSQGLDLKASVRLSTTAALPANTFSANVLTASVNGALSVDGVLTVAGDRVLAKDEAAGLRNGIYTVTQVGSVSLPYILTRAIDADATGKMSAGTFTFVEEGITNSDSGWVISTDNPITLNTTSITWTQFSGAGTIVAGAGLLKTGSVIDIILGSTGGLIINADDLGVNFASVAETDAKALTNKAVSPASLINHSRRFTQSGVSIGSTPGIQTITHNLGTRAVIVSVIDSTTFEEYGLDVIHATTNTVTLTALGATKTVIVTVVG